MKIFIYFFNKKSNKFDTNEILPILFSEKQKILCKYKNGTITTYVPICDLTKI